MITILKDEQYRKSLLVAFREAKEEILIMNYKCDYHATLKSRNLNVLIQELRRARARRVKVKMLLNVGNPYSTIARQNKKAAIKLEEEGIEVRFALTGRTHHAKVIIVDDDTAWVGSHNFCESSLSRNFEITAEIRSPRAIQDLRQIFFAIWYR